MDTKIIKNKELNIWEALIPVFALIGMLAYNVLVAYAGSDDDPESQSTHMHSSPTASDHHDSQANALTTAMLHITHQDDSSET